MLDIPVTAWGIPEKNYANDMSLEIIQLTKNVKNYTASKELNPLAVR